MRTECRSKLAAFDQNVASFRFYLKQNYAIFFIDESYDAGDSRGFNRIGINFISLTQQSFGKRSARNAEPEKNSGLVCPEKENADVFR